MSEPVPTLEEIRERLIRAMGPAPSRYLTFLVDEAAAFDAAQQDEDQEP